MIFIQCPKCYKLLETYSCECGWKKIIPNRATNIICDIEPYFDENLADSKKSPQGQWVKSRQHKRQLLKEQGLAEIG